MQNRQFRQGRRGWLVSVGGIRVSLSFSRGWNANCAGSCFNAMPVFSEGAGFGSEPRVLRSSHLCCFEF